GAMKEWKTALTNLGQISGERLEYILQEMNGIMGTKGNLQHKKQKMFKKRIIWLKLIMIFLMISVLTAFLAMTPIFEIDNVIMSGSSRYSTEYICDVSGIAIGENGFKQVGSSLEKIFSLRLGQAEENIINNCPYVKEATVKYIIPSTVS